MSAVLPLSRAIGWRLPGGLSLSGALSLFAIVAVLVVVSVPRLRELALEENEADARATAQFLAHGLLDEPAGKRKPFVLELVRRPEFAAILDDGELAQRGKLLRRRGYLFEVTRLTPAVSAAGAPSSLLCGESGGLHGALAIRAWPWVHGATGRASFLVTANGAHLEHRNSPDPWQGLESAGADLGTLAGWQPVP